MFTIEFESPHVTACACCAAITTQLARYVHKNDDAYAVYLASFSNHAALREVQVLLSLGSWCGEESSPAARTAFALALRSHVGEQQILVCDAATSPWGHHDLFGLMLDRAAALGHPLLPEAFLLASRILVEDVPVQRYLTGTSSN